MEFGSLFESIPKMALAGGIVIITLALSFLFGDLLFQLTNQIEIVVAVIGVIIITMSFLSYRIFKNV